MNDRTIIPAPGPREQGTWLDDYLPSTGIANFEPRSPLIDTGAIRGILYRQRWIVAGIVLIAAVIGLVATLLATPMYEARASVRVEPYGTQFLEGQDIAPQIASNQVFNLLATQVEVIKSRNLAKIVAENLNLGERTDLLGSNIDERRPPNMTDEQWLAEKENMAAGIIQSLVVAEVPQANWIISIGVRSSDPVLAAELANGYSDAFVASDTRNTVASNEYAQTYLQDQIERVRGELAVAEQASNAYARSNGIIVEQSSGEDGDDIVTLTNSSLVDINTRVSAARAARIEAEQRWRAIQSLPASQLPEVQTSSVMQQLIADRTGKQTELIALRQRYNDDFPEIQDILAQIRALDSQIQTIGNDIKATARSNYLVAQRQEQALENELGSLTTDSLAEQDRQVDFNVLERQADALRSQLRLLLDRFNQVNTAANAQSGRITALDAATVPGSPYAPSLFRNMAVALVLGMAFAGGLAVLRETFDTRIRSLDDVENRLGIPLLGHTPYVEESDIDYAGSNGQFGSLMEAYASIRSTIDFAMPREQNVIQLTSSQESEGKSTTAVILAELFAGMGRKTLLIDADLRRPSVASLAGLEKPKVGIVEVLLGHVDLQTAVISGLHENLDILPVGALPSNPTEIFASNQFRDFIAEYRNEYSLIILDSAPILGLADAPMLSRLVDGTVFVMEANRIQFNQARQACKRLRAGGGNIIGAVLTKYRAMEAGASYDYQYTYYRYGDETREQA
ncbi:GumC family protein [Erythrobacter sp. MTPC3]|uniref:GumC family protein n=1 Tax=Erythrobacter sp. MTPC3 TaxID=3056564 RepID=UPI0036F226B9